MRDLKKQRERKEEEQKAKSRMTGGRGGGKDRVSTTKGVITPSTFHRKVRLQRVSFRPLEDNDGLLGGRVLDTRKEKKNESGGGVITGSRWHTELKCPVIQVS